MEFDHIAEAIARFDPWWMIATALILILLDWFVAQSDALSAIGFSIILLAVLNALGVSAQVQLWSYPIAFFLSYFGQRKLFSKLGQAAVPFESKSSDDHVGQVGHLKVIEGAITGSSHFYTYKDDISVESLTASEKHENLLKVILADGAILPARFVSEGEIIDGLPVEIVSITHGTANVKKRD